jgi:hypothetical protein
LATVRADKANMAFGIPLRATIAKGFGGVGVTF